MAKPVTAVPVKFGSEAPAQELPQMPWDSPGLIVTWGQCPEPQQHLACEQHVTVFKARWAPQDNPARRWALVRKLSHLPRAPRVPCWWAGPELELVSLDAQAKGTLLPKAGLPGVCRTSGIPNTPASENQRSTGPMSPHTPESALMRHCTRGPASPWSLPSPIDDRQWAQGWSPEVTWPLRSPPSPRAPG